LSGKRKIPGGKFKENYDTFTAVLKISSKFENIRKVIGCVMLLWGLL
jgi:hypothetical protein